MKAGKEKDTQTQYCLAGMQLCATPHLQVLLAWDVFCHDIERMLTALARVLVVDDHETFRTLNAKILELDGHYVAMASDGRDALAIVRAEHPDIVLLDVMMPGMDGYQVCRQIKQDPETRDIIVVIVTAIPEDTSSRSFQAGADDHISKPISHTQMRDLVRQWSAKRIAKKGQEL